MTDAEDEALAAAKDRGFRHTAAIDAAYARGELDDAGWHRAWAEIIVPAYLHADTVQGGSGHTGSADDWTWSRGVVGEALHRSGTFLDVGCANGLLMESVERWGAAAGHSIEAHGLDIAPELAAHALQRVPAFVGRIHVGNALGWRPPRRYDFVRTALDYVPRPKRRALIAWLLDEVVAEGGRLIVGKHNETIGSHELADDLQRWGLRVTGAAERAHRSEPRLVYRALWLDAPTTTDAALRFRALRESDLPRLARWLAAPHVAPWWPPALDLEGVRAHYAPRLAGDEPTYMFVIEERARPIGWIQWYRWADYPEHAARLGAAPSSAGIDLGIGEPDRIGAGLGSRAIRAFVEQVVFWNPELGACLSDPHVANTRSLRAFEKAGFRVLPGAGAQHDRRVVRLER